MIVNRIVNRIEIPQEKGSSPSERNIRAPGDKAGPTNRVTRRIDAGFFRIIQNINKFTGSIKKPDAAAKPAREPLPSPGTLGETGIRMLLDRIESSLSGQASAPEKNSGPSSRPRTTRQEIDRLIKKVAARHNLPARLIRAVALAESGLDPTAESARGAQGLMQLMPETAREMGVEDPFEPLQNLEGGSLYLKRLLTKYGGDLEKALAAYNWGPGRTDRLGISKIPLETSAFIARVMALSRSQG